MIDDLLNKFPELVQTLLNKALETSSSTETEERKKAREKLIKQLKESIDTLGKLSKQPGEKVDEELIKKILSIPRVTPEFFPFGFQNIKK